MDNTFQNMSGNIKACIFDLDGTLYNERDFVRSGFRAVAQYVSGISGLSFEVLYKNLMVDFKNGLRLKNFDVLSEKFELSNIKISDLVKIYRQHQPEIQLYPDAKIILKEFKGKVKLGLITDGVRKTQNNKIVALNIEGYFKEIIINDVKDTQSLKPSSSSFRVMLDKLGVEAGESIYIGDNPTKDFIGAKEIGIFTIRVRRGQGEYDNIETDQYHEAIHTVSDLLSIKTILKI